MNLTEVQILTLAPDEASRKAGRDLAKAAKWVTLGANEQAVWGECQGSGSKPYQAQIDLSNIAFKCSCPSRKFPCKHGIGLGLLYARQESDFKDRQLPAWVEGWIGKRAEKEEKKVEKKDKPVDAIAQAKRQQARDQKVANGIEDLLLWIKDIVRNGIMNIPDKGYGFWEGMAKRMVDAQAPGLAGMIKGLGSINFYKEGWQNIFLDRLLTIYLVSKGYQNKATLDPLVLQEVKNWIGFTFSQEELKEQQGVKDTWLVLGKQVTEEDNLTVERNYLYGISANQYAIFLQFLIRGQGATVLLSPGMYIDAELVYYPSLIPFRVLIRHQTITTAKTINHLFAGWKEIAQMETTICSAFPVRNERPFAIRGILPVQFNGDWWLQDRNNDMVVIKDGFNGIWKFLALSGGNPLDIVVVGMEGIYEPIGVWHGQTYKTI